MTKRNDTTSGALERDALAHAFPRTKRTPHRIAYTVLRPDGARAWGGTCPDHPIARSVLWQNAAHEMQFGPERYRYIAR